MLILLPVLALLVVSVLARQLGKVVRVSAAVVSPQENDPESKKRADAVLEAEGLPTQGIAAVSEFLSRALIAGSVGGVTAAVVLMGLALPGFILVWRVRFGAPFVVLASAVWLLAAAGASLVSFGVLDPLPMP